MGSAHCYNYNRSYRGDTADVFYDEEEKRLKEEGLNLLLLIQFWREDS